MLIGDRDNFAIECHHDPIANPARHVYGRMCLWVGGVCLGDPEEPSCMLDETDTEFRDILRRLDSMHDVALAGLSAPDAFALLDNALYLETDQSMEEIEQDYRRFIKFNFLTNAGESFDRTRSFLVNEGDTLRLLFRDQVGRVHHSDVDRRAFLDVLKAFSTWLAGERTRAG